MRVEGQQRKRDGINNKTFIKAGETWRILCYMGRALMQPLSFGGPRVRTTLHVPTKHKATCSLLALCYTASSIPQEPSLHCFAFLSVFITTFFSFMLPMFSLLTAWLDKCVYGISHVYKISTQATVYNK